MDKTLFQNQFLAVIERDGYFFSREIRCDGVIVAILPYRMNDNKLSFLARFEVCPAHGQEPELCSITGGLSRNSSVEETAQKELWEEAGYRVEVGEFIRLGQVKPSKSADTIAHLFAVDVSAKAQSTPAGYSSRFEADASVRWVDYDQGIGIEDPLFVTSLARLVHRIKDGSRSINF